MAKPANPLDKFVTYTYHFELHAAPTWDELKQLKNNDQNGKSEPNAVKDTLILNTRKDAHQIIDEVRFIYEAPVLNQHGLFTAAGLCEISILEPNGAQFVEKLTNMYSKYNVSTLQALIFVLKIFFVGRTPDNQIVTIPMNGVLCLNFGTMTASFSSRGGEYHLSFLINTGPLLVGINSIGGESSLSQSLGYFPKNISVKSQTVKEALTDLEDRLNKMYTKIYETELKNTPGARMIKYFINNEGVDGTITVQNRETTATDEPATIVCDHQQPIISWINNIVRSSKDLNERIGQSRENLYKDGQPGVELISINPRVLYTASNIELHFDVKMYQGSTDDVYEFDFLFANPGKNVDVMSFDMNMNQVESWIQAKSQNGVDFGTDQSATVRINDPKQYATNICVQDTVTTEQVVITEPQPIGGKKNDIALCPPNPRSETSGHIKQQANGVPAARLMFATISDAHAALTPELTFTIRGHLNLLERGLVYPDGEKTSSPNGTLDPLGITAPTYIKVNINSPDKDHKPFFYTGKYQLIRISNMFSNGTFTQNITATMLTEFLQ